MKKSFIRRKLTDGVYAIGLRPLGSDAYRLAILPSVRYWYADPIAVTIAGGEYLFAEAYDRFLKKGFIAAFALELTKRGIHCGKPQKVLQEDFHLSFPVIFFHEGEYYMMPESSGDGSLRFYKMGGTPYEWQLIRRIDMPDSVDTVVIPRQEGFYFLNTEEHPVEKIRGRQRLYFTPDFRKDELEDCSDCMGTSDYTLTSRNGGPVYDEAGILYRVCQNSTMEIYGKSFSTYRIRELSPQAYQEELLETTEMENLKLVGCPDEMELTGTHTYSRSLRVEAVDVSCNYSSVKNVFAKFIRKFT